MRWINITFWFFLECWIYANQNSAMVIYNIHVRNLLNKTSYLRYAILQMFFKLVILFYISLSLMFQKYFVVYIAIHIINFECDKKQKKIFKNSIQFHWRPYFRAWKPIITYFKKKTVAPREIWVHGSSTRISRAATATY